MATAETTAHGVDALIGRLRAEGVAAGEAEAARIKAEAQAAADALLAEAKREAERLTTDARKAADHYRRAGEDALNTAMRDAVLEMRSGLIAKFEADIEGMVSAETADPEMLKRMILEVVGRARDEVQPGDETAVILPAEVVGSAAIRENPDEIQSGALTGYVIGLTVEMMREGVTLFGSEELGGGIHIVVDDKDIRLDLSDKAIAALLLQHMQPRFRAVLEGVIR